MSKRSGPSTRINQNPPPKRRALRSSVGPLKELQKLLTAIADESRAHELAHDTWLYSWNPNHEKELLWLCRQDPSLATTTFDVGDPKMTPLAFLIRYRAKQSLVKVFCHMFPQSLQTKCNVIMMTTH